MKKQPLALGEFIALIGLLMSLTALSISSILPAFPAIAQSLNIATPNHIQFVVTLFFLGMVFGEIIFGTLSDSFGRKISLLMGIFVYICGTKMAGTAQSLEILLVGRVIQGIGVSGPKVVSIALIRDQFEGNAMARVMSFVMTIFILVPMVAPAIGQLILDTSGWRAIFLLFIIHATAVSIWFALRQPETLQPNRRTPFSISDILRSSMLIIKNANAMAYTITAGLIASVHFIFVSTSQSMFEDFYQIREDFPLYFALLAMGIGIASLINSRFVMRYGMQHMLIGALICLTGSSCLLLLSGLLNNGIPPFFWFMPLCFLIFLSLGIVFGNINTMAMQSLDHNAGLGASLIGSMSSILGVVLSILIGQLYNSTIFAIAPSYIVLGSVAIVLVKSTKPTS
jgi:DHA1 family bicyclomycin/chloramphenicol resistance-like MFS transporter